MQNVKKLEIRVYGPTDTKGLRFRIIGLSNSYISFDYKYNYVIDQAMDILEENGYSDNIIDIKWLENKAKYIVLANKE
jgi:hypothetical protein